MKNSLMVLNEKILLRKRSIIETVFGSLKNKFEIEHTRHKSPINFLVHLFHIPCSRKSPAFLSFTSLANPQLGLQRYCIPWKSVIAQAMTDAASHCKKTESLVEKCKAISWLSDFSQDFVHTCILADCDPVYVKNKIQPILKSLTR